jgi:hypothetical protein
MDMIMMVVVDEGEAKFVGTCADLSVFRIDDQETRDAIEYTRSSLQGGAEFEGGGKLGRKVMNGKQNDGKVMTVEEREHGLSSLRIWLIWFKYAGDVPFLVMQFLLFLLLFLMTLDGLAYVSSEDWL